MKVLLLIENLVAGAGSVAYLIESMHGAGPPAAQRIMIGRQAQLEKKIAQVRQSATTSRAGGMRKAPRRGLALLVVADLGQEF